MLLINQCKYIIFQYPMSQCNKYLLKVKPIKYKFQNKIIIEVNSFTLLWSGRPEYVLVIVD